MAYKSYPHPVLNNGDDIAGSFSAKLDILTDSELENWQISIGCDLDNPTLQAMLDNGTAAYLADVESPNSYYRIAKTFKENQSKIIVPADQVRDKVTVQVYIVAAKDIEGYLPEGSHPDYHGMQFKVAQGDILADGGIATLPADPLFDPMAATADSFLKIDKDRGRNEVAYMEVEEDVICIYLPAKDWDNFQEVGGEDVNKEILHAAIVFPMLTAVIAEMQSQTQNQSDEVRPRNIKLLTLLEVRGLMKLPPEQAAQRLLGKPVSRSLAALEGRMN